MKKDVKEKRAIWKITCNKLLLHKFVEILVMQVANTRSKNLRAWNSYCDELYY